MDIKNFIGDFAYQFDDIDLSEFSADTKFRELDEWSSLTALAVLNMIGKKYDKTIKIEEMRAANTIKELYDLVNSK